MIRLIIPVLLTLHGLIHLMGFAKAYQLAALPQLTQSYPRSVGMIWLVTAVLMLLAAVMLFLDLEWWWLPAAVGIVLSQYLIYEAWPDAKMGTIANIILVFGVVTGYATWHYHQQYQQAVDAGLTQSAALPAATLEEKDLAHLPEPVQRYIRLSGAVGAPKVRYFKATFDGGIRKNEATPWMPFVSEQYNFMEPATRLFFMKARMKQLPVAGFHRFQNDTCYMDIRLFSLFNVQYQTGPEMAIAETVTFFNDMCCMAPATLIDPRIQWLSANGNVVAATFTNNGITIGATLYFNDEGQLVNFKSNDRYAVTDNGIKKTPWSTPLRQYQVINGRNTWTSADAVYTYPEGDLIYGTFRLKVLEFNQ